MKIGKLNIHIYPLNNYHFQNNGPITHKDSLCPASPPPVSEAVTALFPVRIDLFAFLTISYHRNHMVCATYCLAFFT